MKMTRRISAFVLLIGLLFFSIANGTADKKATSGKYLAFVGTYTTKTESKGIYAFEFDAESGKLTPKGVAAETPDPSWVAVHPNGKYAYVANEAGKASTVSAFALDAKNGKLTLLNQLPALGEDPCYLSFDKTGNFLFVANYTSGNVVVFPIGADGKLGAATSNVHDQGKLGPNKERQDGPHAHWVHVNTGNRLVHVADLGLDRILIYKFDATRGTLSTGPSESAEMFYAALAPGTGPRHLAFSADGNFMYVLCELKSTVTVFADTMLAFWHDRQQAYVDVQQISALPSGFTGRNDAAEIEIHPTGKFLYTSNRGDDSIADFSINPKKGTLTLVSRVPTGGKEPRHFAIDPAGNFLLAEDQLSNKIVTFRIDQKTGALTPTGDSVQVPSPVCLVFQPVE